MKDSLKDSLNDSVKDSPNESARSGVAHKPSRIAVLASGNGSNFQAVADAAAAGRLEHGRVELLVCDRPGAPVTTRAERMGIAVQLVDPAGWPTRAKYDAEIARVLRAHDIDLVVLAGWMRILTQAVVAPYEGRMINVHPSLLPAFPGKHAIRQALRRGVKVTGVTVHYVDEGVDTGPIISQAAVDVLPGDTEASLSARVHPVEHALLCGAIADITSGRVGLADGRVRVAAPA